MPASGGSDGGDGADINCLFPNNESVPFLSRKVTVHESSALALAGSLGGLGLAHLIMLVPRARWRVRHLRRLPRLPLP